MEAVKVPKVQRRVSDEPKYILDNSRVKLSQTNRFKYNFDYFSTKVDYNLASA